MLAAYNYVLIIADNTNKEKKVGLVTINFITARQHS